jgi:hypothetical protein
VTPTDRGVALIVAVLPLMMIAALAAALAVTTMTESVIGGDFARTLETRYAAEAGLERAIAELPAIADWNLIVSGAVMSRFVDGPPSGSRVLADGASLDLLRVVNLANCGKSTTCSASDKTTNAGGQRPWGANNPVWRLFSYGRVDTWLAAGAIRSPLYVVVLAADDPSETDGNPDADGTHPCAADESPPLCNPGSGAMALRAEAFGARGAHAVAAAIVERSDLSGAVLRTRTQLMSDGH